MKLEIVSAEKNIYSDDVRAVVAPSIEGEIAILDNHAPLLTSLQPGEVRIIQDGSEDIYLYLSGGFIEVLGNHVTILADAAERVEETQHRAREEQRQAEWEQQRAQEAQQRVQEARQRVQEAPLYFRFRQKTDLFVLAELCSYM